jgi:hypothetical protein
MKFHFPELQANSQWARVVRHEVTIGTERGAVTRSVQESVVLDFLPSGAVAATLAHDLDIENTTLRRVA